MLTIFLNIYLHYESNEHTNCGWQLQRSTRYPFYISQTFCKCGFSSVPNRKPTKEKPTMRLMNPFAVNRSRQQILKGLSKSFRFSFAVAVVHIYRHSHITQYFPPVSTFCSDNPHRQRCSFYLPTGVKRVYCSFINSVAIYAICIKRKRFFMATWIFFYSRSAWILLSCRIISAVSIECAVCQELYGVLANLRMGIR